MRYLAIVLLSLSIVGCQQSKSKQISTQQNSPKRIPESTYAEMKDSIAAGRQRLSAKYNESGSDPIRLHADLVDFWVTNISNTLFLKWENTPWDFNGTTAIPKQGTIACGYFVTTVLRDMDLKINRTKLAVCPSSVMMKTLTPRQSLMNLSYGNLSEFDDTLKSLGKGVYIIGLDFHTGFLINDGKDNWFIHSNYIRRQGVTKEPVSNSIALRSSKTKWVISLTRDRDFMQKWLKG
ncbi:MAG: hypothetical protein JWQ27_3202 [Ferruginibacter sp.]|nr:hypothetical protein [Ferruginibacter sp.]